MLFLSPSDVRGLTPRALEEVLERSDLVVAAAEGRVSGLAAAAILFADYGVLRAGAEIHLEVPEAWAGAVWRLGRGAMRLRLLESQRFDARAALLHGLCDEVIEDDATAWLKRWMSGRSELALDAAAALIRMRGGDRLERAEFARLFAAGEPQKGLGAFLGKRKPEF